MTTYNLPAYICALALIAGCSGTGGSGSDDCVAYGYDYDQVGSTGLTLKATGNEHTFISFEAMEAEYIDLEKCVANSNTPGPTVTFTSFNFLGVPLELAFYSYASQTIYIDTDVEDWLPVRNCISDRKFLRHEFAHHVLFLNGRDSEHTSPVFAACDALGPKTCNGQYCED